MAKAFILIETAAGKNKEVITKLLGITGIVSADSVTGPYDLIGVIEAATLNDIGEILTEKIHGIEGITRTVTCLVL